MSTYSKHWKFAKKFGLTAIKKFGASSTIIDDVLLKEVGHPTPSLFIELLLFSIYCYYPMGIVCHLIFASYSGTNAPNWTKCCIRMYLQ